MPSQVLQVQPRRKLLAGRGRGPGAPAASPDVRSRCCPVPGCGAEIDSSRLMCRHDWYAVPKPLRDGVWATWRSGRGAHGLEHQSAVRLAILVSHALRHEPAVGRRHH